MVDASVQVAVALRLGNMRSLHWRRTNVALACPCNLLRVGVHPNAPRSIVTVPIDVMYDDRFVHVDVSYIARVDARNGRVVAERIAVPTAAGVTGTVVAGSVVYSTVVTNVRSPVALIPSVVVLLLLVTPIPGGPEEARLRRGHPRAGHPVVAILALAPIPRDPLIVGLGNCWLLILRHERGSCDTDVHLGVRRHRKNEHGHERAKQIGR